MKQGLWRQGKTGETSNKLAFTLLVRKAMTWPVSFDGQPRQHNWLPIIIQGFSFWSPIFLDLKLKEKIEWQLQCHAVNCEQAKNSVDIILFGPFGILDVSLSTKAQVVLLFIYFLSCLFSFSPPYPQVGSELLSILNFPPISIIYEPRFELRGPIFKLSPLTIKSVLISLSDAFPASSNNFLENISCSSSLTVHNF